MKHTGLILRLTRLTRP